MIAFRSFGADALGALPSDFVRHGSSALFSWKVATETGALDGRALVLSSDSPFFGSWSDAVRWLTPGLLADVEMVTRLKFISPFNATQIFGRGDTASTPTRVGGEADANGGAAGQVQIREGSGQGSTLTSADMSLTTGTWYGLSTRLSGTTIRVRLWVWNAAAADYGRGTGWDLTYTNAGVRNVAGYVGLYANASGGAGSSARFAFDRIGFATGSEQAPLEPIEAPSTPEVGISDVLTVAARLTGSAFAGDTARTHTDSQFRVLREDATIAYDSGTGLGPVLTAYATGLTSGMNFTGQIRYKDDLAAWSVWGETDFQTKSGDALITDYASLRRALARWLNRRDLEEDIPVFIQLAENRLRRDSRCKVLVADVPTISADGMSLPSAMKALEGWFHDGPVNFGALEVVSYNELAGLKARYGQTGVPRYVALVGGVAYFAPVPDGSYATKRAYWAMPTPLSDASPMNTLILAEPDIYLYGALCESAPYLKEDPRMATWTSELEFRLGQMDLAAWHKQFGGAGRERFRPIGG